MSGTITRAPHRDEPRLTVSWLPGRTIVVLQRFKISLGDSPGPFVQVIEDAEAVDLPTLLVLPARVRDQKDAPRLERPTDVHQYAPDVPPRDVK